MNLWMKRAIGAAALGGGLLALGAGAGSGAIRARVRVPRAAGADVSIGTRRGRPATTASGQASATRRARAAAAADTSPSADATATLSRPRAGRLFEVGPLAGETPAGIGVLESGPIASGNQVDVDAGDISPSIPVTVCGNSAGVLGDASASCGGGTTPGSGSEVDLGTILDAVLDTGTGSITDPGAGVDIGVDVGIGGDISTGGIIAPTPPATTPGRTDTVGTPGSGSTGTSGIPGTLGLPRAAPARPPPSRRCAGRSPAPAPCRSPAPAATCWPCSPPGCWPRAPCSCGQLGPPPQRKEVGTGNPAEAAGQQALMVTGRRGTDAWVARRGATHASTQPVRNSRSTGARTSQATLWA